MSSTDAPYYIANPNAQTQTLLPPIGADTVLAGPPGAGASSNNGLAKSLSESGLYMTLGGVVTGAVGQFYGVRAQQHEIESAALSADHEQSMARINARIAEFNAREIELAGRKQISLVQMANAQERGELLVRQAASGVELGSGSAQEARVSQRLRQEIDELTITRNVVAQAGAARLRAVGVRNRGILAGASARNLRASSRSLSAGLAAGTTLLSGAGTVATQFANDLRFR